MSGCFEVSAETVASQGEETAFQASKDLQSEGGNAESPRSGSPTFVAMVQTADFGERNDLSLFRELHWSRFRGIFLQAQVSSASVIVCEVGFE